MLVQRTYATGTTLYYWDQSPNFPDTQSHKRFLLFTLNATSFRLLPNFLSLARAMADDNLVGGFPNYIVSDALVLQCNNNQIRQLDLNGGSYNFVTLSPNYSGISFFAWVSLMSLIVASITIPLSAYSSINSFSKSIQCPPVSAPT